MEDVPAQAIMSLADPDDPNTSFWDEGIEKETLLDVLLSLALNRSRIGAMHFGSLWQNQLAPDLALRILQRDDAGPYVAGRHLHYQLEEPVPEDYPRLALGIARRQNIETKGSRDVKDLLENAYFLRKFSLDDLPPSLRSQVCETFKKRFIKAGELDALEPQPPIFDVSENGTCLIPGSRTIDFVQVRETRSIPDIKKSALIVLYCTNGDRSRLLAQILRRNEYNQVKSLYRGLDAWQAAGLPVTA